MFRKVHLFNYLCLPALILLAAIWLRDHRPPLGTRPATAGVRWVPVVLPPITDGRARLAGAWRLQSNESRLGGFSGLAIDRGGLLAVTDSGMLAWLPTPPGPGRATLRPLPAVSGNPRTKIGRDSEALARDPRGGWWVAFEQHHQLIRYDSEFGDALQRIDVDDPGFRRNRGIEALRVEGTQIRWFAESSGVSDAASMPDGRRLLLHRGWGLKGARAALSGLGGPEIRLPVGPLDNAEGLAARMLPSGATRLWIVTDNDFRPWRRTLLIAVDLPADGGG